MDSISFSQSVSKEFGNEKTSISELYFEDLDRRIDAITTEVIEKGNTVLDTYKVLSDAISGGMGSVWRVHHNSWNTDLAMKRPQPRFFTEGGDKRKEQFIKECENWINLGLHPNIVSCYYVRELGGVPTIFSEWMDGGSLKERIADGSLYQGSEQEVQERILDIAIQAARGLQYSHENGLIHQDMKPGNLLLTKDWDAKVADFGLAKAKSNLSASDTAKSSGYTIAYCPKEQSDGEEPQRWMNVYAWALTVLEMYAGKRLWETGADAKEHIDEYPSQCAQKLPNEMCELLRSCLNDMPDGFDAILQKAEQIYRQASGRSYGRERFDSKTTSVDNLNNYALSMLDLGLCSEALNTWDKLLAAHPDHVQSIINRAFYLWRSAKITDARVESTLEFLPNSEEKAEAMELFRLERGDLMETREGLVSSGKNYHSTKTALFDTNDTLLTVKAYVDQPRNIQQVMQNITSGRPAKTHHKLSRVRFKTGESHDVSLRETELLTLTRDRKKAIAGRTNSLFLIDLENGDQTADITIDMTDDQRYQAYPEHNDMWASAPSVTMYNIKFEDRSSSGRGVIRKQQKPEWESIWLEENDTVLCVVEKTCWEKASDVAEHRKWEKKRKGQPPKVNYTHADHLLRFSLDENLHARLIEIKKVAFNRTDPLKPLLPHEGRFERGSADKKTARTRLSWKKRPAEFSKHYLHRYRTSPLTESITALREACLECLQTSPKAVSINSAASKKSVP